MLKPQAGSLAVCPSCRRQARYVGAASKAHFRCERCSWEVIVDDGSGKVFSGTDASQQYVNWINDPGADLPDLDPGDGDQD